MRKKGIKRGKKGEEEKCKKRNGTRSKETEKNLVEIERKE
jgi:hypothetical protein